MVTGCKLSIEDSSKDVDQSFYRFMISSLLYVTDSRPDVMQVVGQVERFQAAPKESHIKYSPALEYLCQKLQILPSSHQIFPFQNIKGEWKQITGLQDGCVSGELPFAIDVKGGENVVGRVVMIAMGVLVLPSMPKGEIVDQ